jgi:hypothetical protein
MTVMDLVQRVEALEARALVLRDVLGLLDRAFPRGDHNFVLVDGERKRVGREVVEEVRRLLLSQECASWRERQDLLAADLDRVVPVKSKKSGR